MYNSNFAVFFRDVMVLLQSMITGHKRTAIRQRLDDKVEKIAFDPFSE